MTAQQALDKLAEDRVILEHAISDIQTAESLYALGETDKAIEIGCAAWFSVRSHYHTQWGTK